MVNRGYHVIVDDREAPPAEVQRLSGDVHFGNLLRRRRRYLDELVATAVDADDVTCSAHRRGGRNSWRAGWRRPAARALWLRLPTSIAPLDLAGLRVQIGKMRYALEPMMLAPVSEDDAPMVLFPRSGHRHSAGRKHQGPACAGLPDRGRGDSGPP